MENKLALADLSDLISFTFLGLINVGDILEYIYMGVFIFSLLFGIVMRIIAAAQDRKITKEEAEEIQKASADAAKSIKEEAEKFKKEDTNERRESR